jgi:hypothetical protein
MYTFLEDLSLDNTHDKLLLISKKFIQDKSSIDFRQDQIIKQFKALDLGYDEKPIANALSIISRTEKLSDALNFLTYAIVIEGHPSDHYIYQTPKLKSDLIDFELFNLLAILSLIYPSIISYQHRKIEQKHIDFNLNHLKGYIRNFFNKHQTLGIENFGWTTYLASLGLIHIKSLQFMHHIYNDPFIGFVHKDNKQLMVLVDGEKNINHLGQFTGTNQVNDVEFKTSFVESKDAYEGYLVNPKGYVTKKKIVLSKSNWEIAFKSGSQMIDFHIPTKTPYDISSIKDSFIEAKLFFNKHFNDYEYKGFWCVSWLYSPQIPQIIKNEKSRILNIYEQGYVCPSTIGASALYSFVFHNEQPDFSKITPKTTLEKDVIEFISQKKTINCGLFIVLMDDVSKFGKKHYQNHFDLGGIL